MRKKIYPEEKCEIVRRGKAGAFSQRHAAGRMGVHVSRLQAWIRIYDSEGPEDFIHAGNKSYSDDGSYRQVKNTWTAREACAQSVKSIKFKRRYSS